MSNIFKIVSFSVMAAGFFLAIIVIFAIADLLAIFGAIKVKSNCYFNRSPSSVGGSTIPRLSQLRCNWQDTKF